MKFILCLCVDWCGSGVLPEKISGSVPNRACAARRGYFNPLLVEILIRAVQLERPWVVYCKVKLLHTILSGKFRALIQGKLLSEDTTQSDLVDISSHHI
jgi:hypothetical protein